MPQRDYSLNFLTTAELSGAKAAEKAVDQVGDAATKSGDKLDAFQAEFKASMDKLKARVDGMKDQLRESGEQGGKAAGEGMGEGINLAANLHLIQQAWSIGSQIGGALSKALIASHEGGLEELKTSILAGMGFWEAQVTQQLQTLAGTMPAEHREINAKVLREYRAFWDDYLDAKPDTAAEWLDEIAKKADIAATQLRGLNDLQTAAMKAGKSQIEQDFLDKRQDIVMSDDPESVKARKLAAAEAEKRQREAEQRDEERRFRGGRLTDGLSRKEVELADVQRQEDEQRRRAEAYSNAKAMADADIAARKGAGQNMTDQQERDTRGQFIQSFGRNAGLTLDPNKDEDTALAELTELKKRRVALEREVEKARIETAVKQQALELEKTTDEMATRREDARAAREAQAKVSEARRAEMEKEAAEKQKRADYEAANQPGPPAPPPPPAPGQEQAPAEDLARQVGDAAQATGNSGLKLALEELKRSLADGASAQELKEAAALMQRASAEKNDAMSAIVSAVRSSIDATASALAKTRSEMDALRASVENLKSTR